jgi:hypothetical protein
MTTYTASNTHRKIYEQHFGPIPKDQDGRTYDVHHIDGNHFNNDPANLKAVSIEEHYQIHFSQGDWAACQAMAIRMSTPPHTISELARRATLAKVEAGTHPWLGGEVSRRVNQERIEAGTHNFITMTKEERSAKAKQQVIDGRHPFVGDRNPTYKRLADGTHHFLGGEVGGKASRERVKNGTHNMLGGDIQRRAAMKLLAEGNHPSQHLTTCIYCRKTGAHCSLKPYHFDKCKKRPPLLCT